MKYFNTLSQIDDFIFEKERELNLFNETIKDVKVWSIIRANIKTVIEGKLGLIEVETKNGGIKQRSKFLKFKLQLIRNLQKIFKKRLNIKNFFSKKLNIKYILFATGRDFKGRDLYCENLLDIIPNNEIFIIDTKQINWLKNSVSISSLVRYFKIQKNIDFSRVEFENSNFFEFETQLKNHFQIQIDLFYVIKVMLLSFIVYNKICHNLLNLMPNVKKIFMVNATGGMLGVSFEAKKRGVISSELQHGIILENSLEYNFPKDLIDASYLPSQIYTFGSGSVMTSTIMQTLAIGAPKIVKEFYNKNISRNLKQILFIGQSIVGNFFDLAREVAILLPDFEIKHILHPSDIKPKSEIKKIENGIPNFKIYNNIEANIYELLKSSEIVVSKISNILMEATLFQNRIFIIDIKNDISALEDFIKIGVFPIKSAEELKYGILTGKGKINPEESFRYYEIKTEDEIKQII